MRKASLYLYIILILSLSEIRASTLNNFDKIDELVSNAISEIYVNYIDNNVDTLYYQIVKGEGDWLIEKKLISQKKHNIVLLNSDKVQVNKNNIKIVIEKIGVNIDNYGKSKDSLTRNCFIKLGITLYDKLSTPAFFYMDKQIQDVMSYEDANKANKNSFSFANAIIPFKQPTFFQKILEPVIVVAVIAATTFLFFSVRSN